MGQFESGNRLIRETALDTFWARCKTSSMPKRSSKRKKRPIDTNQLAKSIVDEATSDAADEAQGDDDADNGKNPAAVALGRLGGKKGGIARAANLSASKRSAIARKAAKARWKKKKRKSTE